MCQESALRLCVCFVCFVSRFVVSLDLNMAIQEVFQFFILADKDNDYRVMWREVRPITQQCTISTT